MSAVASVTITGIAEMRMRLTPEAFRTTLVDALRTALAPVASSASALAPHKSGKLAGSIRAAVSTRGGTISAAIVTGVRYGHLVEYGHRMVAHAVTKGELFSITTVSTRGASRGLNLGQRISLRSGRDGDVALA